MGMGVMRKGQARRRLAGPGRGDGVGPPWAVPTQRKPVHGELGSQAAPSAQRRCATKQDGPGSGGGGGVVGWWAGEMSSHVRRRRSKVHLRVVGTNGSHSS